MNMKKTNITIAILTLFVILIIANYLAARHPIRLDLTEKRAYTLSDATRSILKDLDDVVTVRVYFTEDIPPTLQTLRRNVDDLLAEFKSVAGRKIQVEFIDPNSSALEEQKAAMLGIPPVQLNVIERDKQEVAKIYLGMTVMFGDRQQTIPVVSRAENLEYDLAEAIIKVSSKELPTIGWLEFQGKTADDDENFQAIRWALSRRYEVEIVGKSALADFDSKKIAALIMISPGELGADEIFSLDQYVMGGGKLIALVDRFEISQSLSATTLKTNVIDLLKHYGVTVEDALVLDQSNAMAAFSGGPVTYHLPYPYWPEIRRDQFNQSQPIVSDLESVVLPWTSPLDLAEIEDKGGDEEALAKSTPYAVSQQSGNITLDPQSANEAVLGGKRESKVLVALLEGPFGSYFSSGKAQVPKGRKPTLESPGGSRIFVVGSSRWISDEFLQNFPSNAALFQNAVDSFAMSDKLIGIRSREDISRPIAILSDGARTAVKYANLATGPIILILIGIVIFFVRRNRQRVVRLSYEK